MAGPPLGLLGFLLGKTLEVNLDVDKEVELAFRGIRLGSLKIKANIRGTITLRP